jgi:hypothetical protein
MSAVIHLGSLEIDPVEYGSQGNAILGIRDSGKTYTATFMAERLFEAGIPFIVFDPIGVWRFLRVPARHQGGKGYPVVVAGGEAGDLPLTVAGAPEIVRAAMHNGVSLVIDLFDMKLSKADWRRIVTACVRVLLHENQKHGLRHVFLEEAAEFVPQKVLDGAVYAEIEKLARMGGNSRLGYTLINQRSQEVAKAVLELCENMFLHRQRGKNALDNLDKWLQIAGAAEQKEIIRSLPSLAQGECWAWLGGDKPTPPTLVKVPRKNSLHPDRRVMRGDNAVKAKGAVDVGQFVEGMKSTLVEVEAADKANNPALLRARIAELEAAAKRPAAGEVTSQAQRAAEYQRGHGDGQARGFHQGLLEAAAAYDGFGKHLGLISAAVERATIETRGRRASLDDVIAKISKSGSHQTSAKAAPTPMHARAAAPLARKPSPAASGDGALTNPQAHLLRALAWWLAMGHREPTRAQLAAIAGWKVGGSNMRGQLGELSAAGLICYPSSGTVAMTPAGEGAAPAPHTNQTLVGSIQGVLTNPQRLLFDKLLETGAGPATREALGAAIGWQPFGSNMRGRLGELSSLELITYPSRGHVALQDWVVA